MEQPVTERFQRILESARRRDGSAGVDTMIVNSHLAQMRMFMMRQGIEFYPIQDTFGFRRTFINALVEENEIDVRLEGIIDDFLIDGLGLWFFRPVGDSYRVMWFSKENYRAYYDALGQIDELELVYSFSVRQTGFMPPGLPGTNGQQQWVKLVVRKDVITETISSEKPAFDSALSTMAATGGKTREVINSLGFIPAVEAFNNMRSSGMDATGEFARFGEHIVVHDDLVKNIRSNIRFFGSPTLVSSRPKSDLVESGGSDGARPTISSQAGFYSAGQPSSRVSAPTGGGILGGRVPRIIANIEPTDRAVYLTPDAVSGDQNLYTRQYREEIRNALGGVDELGISTGATAYEIKSLFGRAATTAARKCRGLLTYGLAKLLALVIYHEERIFKDSFAAATGLKKPEPPIRETFEDDARFSKALEKFQAAGKAYEAKLDAAIRAAVQKAKMPPGVVGLIPDGDRRVAWRWKGPVFEESTEDVVNNSIVVRNLQELGVNSIEALKYLFPDKTDGERSAMLSGYPFRMAQATQQSIGTFLSLIQQMQQIPHPQAPNLPLLADPRLDLTPLIQRAFEFLRRELTYAGQYDDATVGGDPATLDALQRGRAERGLSANASPDGPTFVPTPGAGFGSAGFGAPGQSLAGGVQSPVQREFDRDAELPVPGSLLGGDPTGNALSGYLPFGTGGLPGGSARMGAADLAAPTNAGLPAAPGLAGGPAVSADRARQRRVPGKRK
jgi:hypothetical protein